MIFNQQADLLDQLNIIFQPLRFKARAFANWDHGPISARLMATHVGGYTNNLVTPSQDVDSYTPVDLTLTWRVADSFAMEMADQLMGVTMHEPGVSRLVSVDLEKAAEMIAS